MVLAHLVLGPRNLPWFIVFVLAVLTGLAVVASSTLVLSSRIVDRRRGDLRGRLHRAARRRSAAPGSGSPGAIGESMLVDLRDRILSQGMLPALPPGWYAESALRSAGGTPFAGDFVVASRPGWGNRLELVRRRRLRQGRGGGHPCAAALRRLRRAARRAAARGVPAGGQRVPPAPGLDEGFATAIHISLDLETGDFEIRSAGHPPAAQLRAGSGRWLVHESEGPVLGLIEDAEFRAGARRVWTAATPCCSTPTAWWRPAAATSRCGIDRMLGQSRAAAPRGFENGARGSSTPVGTRSDDRALSLVHRR